jgi:hypothetical protein
MAKKTKYYRLTREEKTKMIESLDMPERDKKNLMFLMQCTPDEMVSFLQTAPQDDIDYADGLFRTANKLIAKKLLAMDNGEDDYPEVDVKDFKQAKDYLKKFMLKGDNDGTSDKRLDQKRS